MSTSKTYSHRRSYQRFMTQYRLPSQGGGIYNQLQDPVPVVQLMTDAVTYGNNIPDWRERIRLKLDATTSLEGTSYQVRYFGGTCQMYLRDFGQPGAPFELYRIYSGDLSAAYVEFATNGLGELDLTADDRARSKYLKHYIQATNTWRGGNFMAEIGETIHMLRHPVKSLFDSTFKFAKEVAKRRRIPVRNLRKTVSDAWLTWAFGVKPLIADCNDAVSAVNELKQKSSSGVKSDTKIVSGSGRRTFSDYNSVNSINMVPGDPGSGARFHFQSKKDLTVRYRTCLKARLEDSVTVGQQFGVSLDDFAPAVWEAIPWSFFIDYFANIGELIDSMRLATVEQAWGYISIRNAGTYNARPIAFVNDSSTTGYLTGGGFYTLAKYVKRYSSGIPAPRFHFQIPGIGSNAWLNIAALREQVFHASGSKGIGDHQLVSRKWK